MEGIDSVRGRAAYHVVFAIDGGIPFFRVHDRYESWIDVETLSSLRHRQHISEGRYKRNTTYEIFLTAPNFKKTASRFRRASRIHSTTARSSMRFASPESASARRVVTIAISVPIEIPWC